MGNGINKVLPELYLGNIKDARDRELLVRHNITHILSIHDAAAPVLEDMTYLCISAADHSKQNLTQFFRDSIMFIHEARLKGEGCLVHCSAAQPCRAALPCSSAAQPCRAALPRSPAVKLCCAALPCSPAVKLCRAALPRSPAVKLCCALSVAGVSRSVTLVVAYIMTVTGRGWVEALAAVRAARPCAGPNLGFLRQLVEFENTELTQYRAWWKDRYGKDSFSDQEEVAALLTRKSASIPPAL